MSWNPRDQFVERIFQTSRCWTRRLPLLWTRSSRIPSSRKKVSIEEQKAQKDDRFPRERQIAFMIYDYFRVTGAHDTVLNYADSSLLLFMMTIFWNSIQDGTKFYCICQQLHPMMCWKVCDTRFYATQNCIGIVRHGDSAEDIGSKLSKAENHGEEECRSETSITKLWRWAWENWIRSIGKESKWINRRWRRIRCLLPVERGEASVRMETFAVSGTRPKIVRKNQNTLPPRLLSQPYHEVEVCRGREVSEAKVIMGPFFDNVQVLFERYLYVNVLWTWHPPECQFYKHETGCKAADKCLFSHYKVDEQQIKSQKKSYFPKRTRSDDKNAVAIVKKCCVSQDSDALVSQGRKSRRSPMQKVLEPIQRVRFTKSTLGQASIREKKGPLLGKMNVEVPHQRSPFAMKFEYRSSIKIVKVSSDVPEARRGILPKTFTSSKKKTRLQPRAKVELGSGKLSEGPNLWYFLEDENNEGFL